jgi:acetyl esterase/lipase
MRVIAQRAGIATYVVDYQLAPEAKYPVQIEEIEYVVRWLFDHAAEQGVDPEKIAPAGSENRTGLYLETNGIYEMVRNLLKNVDDSRDPYITPMNAASHADLPPAILVTNDFDPLRDVGHAYARKLAADGNDLTYVHNPDLTHGFPQFTRYSKACLQATEELADLIKARIG